MDKIIEYMLAEDEGFGDITSNAVVDEGKNVNAYIVSKDEGILAGIDIICDLFEECLTCAFNKKDFIDTNSDNSHLLRTVLLSCSYKIYVQNITMREKKEE